MMLPHLLFTFLICTAHSCAPSISDKVRRKTIYEATHSLAAGRWKFQTTTFPSLLKQENVESFTRVAIPVSSTLKLSHARNTARVITGTIQTSTLATINSITPTTTHTLEITTTEETLSNELCALEDIGSESRNIPVNMEESEALIEFVVNTEKEQTAELRCEAASGKTTIIEISGQPSLRDETFEEDARLIVICNNGHWFSEEGLEVANINCYHINSAVEQFK